MVGCSLNWPWESFHDICKSNHDAVHLKLIQCCVSVRSQLTWKKKKFFFKSCFLVEVSKGLYFLSQKKAWVPWGTRLCVFHLFTPHSIQCIVQAYLVLQRFVFLCFLKKKLNVCGNPVSNKTIGAAIFPTVFAHFVPPCHILVIFAIFQTFSSLLYLLWWSLISGLWCYYCNWLGHREPCPYKMANVIYKRVYSDRSTHWLFPNLSPSSWSYLFPDTQQYWN